MEHEQLGTLIRREYRRMVNYIRARVHSVSEMDAEDFVQDVLVSVLERADPALPLENLAAYVYRSLRNRVIDFFRTRKPNVTLEGRPGEEEEGLKAVLKDVNPDSLARLGAQEMEAALYRALQSLKPMEQDVIMAHALEGASFKELSEAWEVPVNTLLSHKARGMARLKEYFLKNEKEARQ
jgi:RNA polymerase sigma factor (sigma-70 family)